MCVYLHLDLRAVPLFWESHSACVVLDLYPFCSELLHAKAILDLNPCSNPNWASMILFEMGLKLFSNQCKTGLYDSLGITSLRILIL